MNEKRDQLYTVLDKLEANSKVVTAFITQENGMIILSNLPKEQANLAKAIIAMTMASFNNLMQKLDRGPLSHLVAQGNNGKIISIPLTEQDVLSTLTTPSADTEQILEKMRECAKAIKKWAPK